MYQFNLMRIIAGSDGPDVPDNGTACIEVYGTNKQTSSSPVFPGNGVYHVGIDIFGNQCLQGLRVGHRVTKNSGDDVSILDDVLGRGGGVNGF